MAITHANTNQNNKGSNALAMSNDVDQSVSSDEETNLAQYSEEMYEHGQKSSRTAIRIIEAIPAAKAQYEDTSTLNAYTKDSKTTLLAESSNTDHQAMQQGNIMGSRSADTATTTTQRAELQQHEQNIITRYITAIRCYWQYINSKHEPQSTMKYEATDRGNKLKNGRIGA